MLEFVSRMYSPCHNTTICTASDEFLCYLRVEVRYGLPRHAVDGVGKIFVIDVMQYLTIQGTDYFELAICKADSGQASILTNSCAADLLFRETNAEAIRKVAEGGVPLLLGFW